MHFFNKSKKIHKLSFDYNCASLIRFYNSKGVVFYKAINLSLRKLIDVINHLILESGDIFYVGYVSDSFLNMEVYIGPNGLQSKPYLFNGSENIDKVRGSEKSIFVTMRISNDFYQSLEKLSSILEVNKGQILGLALVNEYYLGYLSGRKNIIHLTESDLKDSSVLKNNKKELEVEISDSRLDEKALIDELDKITGYGENIKLNVNKFMKGLKEKTNMEEESLRFRISGLDVNDNVICKNYLPYNFLLNKVENLFSKNLNYYQFAYKLEVCDLITGVKFNHYPVLNGISGNDKQFCNFSLSKKLYSWMKIHVKRSERTFNSLNIQALYNSVENWESHLEGKDIDEVKLNLNKLVSVLK